MQKGKSKLSKSYVNVSASGADRASLEEDAFRQAREFFGSRPCLEIAYQYSTKKEADGLYRASISVREVTCEDSHQHGRRRCRLCR